MRYYCNAFILNVSAMSARNTTVRMEEGKLARLDQMAKAINRSRAWVINEAIDRYLDYEEWFVQQVEQSVEVADRGEFATEDEVRKRFQNWGVDVEG